ncbi:hypothetical protein Pint_02842 [Pistacia integerrima]|uniref:Uncharacterized protein n=2 Tax=Pistacia TaxID=55512 RepID=A0ACC1C6J4_9ROSI|nr:hypothetical protein Pint_02842 [Pistacia integerrima]KAJ0111176.1 hypothetical protein Patl1_02865 [Pistacia atlantica]
MCYPLSLNKQIIPAYSSRKVPEKAEGISTHYSPLLEKDSQRQCYKLTLASSSSSLRKGRYFPDSFFSLS